MLRLPWSPYAVLEPLGRKGSEERIEPDRFSARLILLDTVGRLSDRS
ncbi:hypothetical protein OG407_47770 [Streptomyces sp. NBC_01515]